MLVTIAADESLIWVVAASALVLRRLLEEIAVSVRSIHLEAGVPINVFDNILLDVFLLLIVFIVKALV